MERHVSGFQTIETTAGEATAELQRRGIGAADIVTIMVDPSSDLLTKARAASRTKIAAAGLTDDDIDALIKRARAEVAAETQ
jgi:hypothetical protein